MPAPSGRVGRKSALAKTGIAVGSTVPYARSTPAHRPSSPLVPHEWIAQAILLIRGQKLLLDRDIAALYDAKPIALRQQVKRNRNRFPSDFLFQLSPKEVEALVSQSV